MFFTPYDVFLVARRRGELPLGSPEVPIPGCSDNSPMIRRFSEWEC